MIQHVECPYCDNWNEVNHDDYYFYYNQGVPHEMLCQSCEKHFVFYTEISLSYKAQKADCLNGEEHDWVPMKTIPKEFTEMQCKHCLQQREPTNDERIRLELGSKEDYFNQLQKEA